MKSCDLQLSSIDDKPQLQEKIQDLFKSGGLAKSGLLGDKQQKKQRLKTMYSRGYQIFKDGLLKQISQSVVSQDDTVKSDNNSVDLVVPRTGSAQYYRVKNKWFNADGVPVTSSSSIKYLDQQVDSGNAREHTQANESVIFNKLSKLIEDKILFEDSSIKNIITNYVNNQIKDLPTNAEYKQQVFKLIDTVSKEYQVTRDISDNTLKQLWDSIFKWSISDSKKYQDVKDTKYKPKDVNNNGVEDHEERTRLYTDYVKKLQQIDVNDKRQLKDLTDTIQQLGKFVSQ